MVSRLLALGLVATSLGLAACGDDDAGENAPNTPAAEAPAGDPGPVHVHGLGVDPADDSLFVATHTGLYRAAPGEQRAARVGDSQQDVMGFSIAGKRRFIGSGHPDPRDSNSPPNLGLIESSDGGRSWRQVSLAGEVDFHVLRSAGARVYGFDATGGRLLASEDGGREWDERSPPGPVVDLAIDPSDPEHVVIAAVQTATGRDGLYESRDGGESWDQLVRDQVGLLAWESPGALFLIDGTGTVRRSGDGGRGFEERGQIGGQPAAFIASGENLYAALPDGTVKASADDGQSWVVRSSP